MPLLFLFVALALGIYALAVMARAQSILRDVSALRVGVSSIDEVQKIAKRHRGDLREDQCTANGCFFSFEVLNTWLQRLWLEPAARFFADIEVREGKVDFVEIMLTRDTRVYPTFPSAGMTREFIQFPARLRNGSVAYMFPSPLGKPYIDVELTSQATAMQHQHAYAYSMKCLIKMGGGCNLPCDYLPLAWHDWDADVQKAGFALASVYPSSARCG